MHLKETKVIEANEIFGNIIRIILLMQCLNRKMRNPLGSSYMYIILTTCTVYVQI